MDLSTEVATRLKLVDQDAPAFAAPETHSFDTGHQRYSGEGMPRLTKVRMTVMTQIMCGPFIFVTLIYFVILMTLFAGDDGRSELRFVSERSQPCAECSFQITHHAEGPGHVTGRRLAQRRGAR